MLETFNDFIQSGVLEKASGRPKVICAFPGMGKSTFIKSNSNSVDFDRCYFQYRRLDQNTLNPTADNVEYELDSDGESYISDMAYPNNFIEAVRKTLNSDRDYILCSTNTDILTALEIADVSYYIVMPEPRSDGKLPFSYQVRYYDRFNNDPEYAGIKNDAEGQNRFIDEIAETFVELNELVESGKLEHCKKTVYVTGNKLLKDVIDECN